MEVRNRWSPPTTMVPPSAASECLCDSITADIVMSRPWASRGLWMLRMSCDNHHGWRARKIVLPKRPSLKPPNQHLLPRCLSYLRLRHCTWWCSYSLAHTKNYYYTPQLYSPAMAIVQQSCEKIHSLHYPVVLPLIFTNVERAFPAECCQLPAPPTMQTK